MKHKLIYSLIALSLFQAGCTVGGVTESVKESPIAEPSVSFTDVSEKAGITSIPAWKYGGPAVSDINNDGYYDFLLTNHDSTPIQFFIANGDNTYTAQGDIYPSADVHGLSAGDYDGDGDNDVLISLGGGNGTTPQPPRMMRNDNGQFVDVTVESGISNMGARGRSVRWIDLDNDGDLDFLQINAEQMIDETGPRNILFENIGNGSFTYRSSPHFEHIDAEKVLLTDINGDHVLDLIAFNAYSPLTVWQGNNDFTFTNVTQKVLPAHLQELIQVSTVAEADISSRYSNLSIEKAGDVRVDSKYDNYKLGEVANFRNSGQYDNIEIFGASND